MRKINWKTTLMGIFALASLFLNKTPREVFTSQETIAQVVVAVGLILAKDGTQKDEKEFVIRGERSEL